MIKHKPFTGFGPDQFKANYMHYQALLFKNEGLSGEELLADNTIFAFNEPLRITAELGLIGFLLLLLVCYSAIYCNVQEKQNDIYMTGAKAGLVGLFVFAMFSYPGQIFTLQMVFVVYIAIVAGLQKEYRFAIKAVKAKPKVLSRFFKVILLSAVSFLLLVYIPKTLRLTKAYRNFKTVVNHQRPKYYHENIAVCEQIYPELKADGHFLLMYGNLLKNCGEYAKATDILTSATSILPVNGLYLALGECFEEQLKFAEAEQAYNYALQMIPSRIKPVYALAKLYAHTCREEEALCLINDYLENEPKKRTIASFEIELELIDLKKEIENYFETEIRGETKNE